VGVTDVTAFRTAGSATTPARTPLLLARGPGRAGLLHVDGGGIPSRSDIDPLNAQFAQALEKGDAATIASLYAPDAVALPPGMPMASGSAIQDLWQGMADMGVTGGIAEDGVVRGARRRRDRHGQYEVRAGTDVVDVGKYLVVHRRRPNGSWNLGIDMWNSDSAPQPA
jgi:ketosteroid isomerase-like protein